MNLFALSQQLNKLNTTYPFIEIIEYNDGLPALESFLKNNKEKSKDNLHIMIIDQNMPGMKGD